MYLAETSNHLEEFAKEGLRTLCLAHADLDEDFYEVAFGYRCGMHWESVMLQKNSSADVRLDCWASDLCSKLTCGRSWLGGISSNKETNENLNNINLCLRMFVFWMFCRSDIFSYPVFNVHILVQNWNNEQFHPASTAVHGRELALDQAYEMVEKVRDHSVVLWV